MNDQIKFTVVGLQEVQVVSVPVHPRQEEEQGVQMKL